MRWICGVGFDNPSGRFRENTQLTTLFFSATFGDAAVLCQVELVAFFDGVIQKERKSNLKDYLALQHEGEHVVRK